MRRFVPFLLSLFAIAALMRISFFFSIAYLFFGIYLLTRLWNGRMLQGVQVHRQFVNRAFWGDQVLVKLLVHNTSRLPIPWLEVQESLPVDLRLSQFRRQVTSLGPRERWECSYTLKCRRRGYYPLGPLTMTAGDLLGLEQPRSAQVPPKHIIVYPQVVPLQQLGLPTHSPLVALPARSPLFEDPARVIGVRDYQRGDSPRRIHWTATASAGQLLVKQYQPAIARETLICLDLDEAGYQPRQIHTATELAIVVAASLANHIVVREGLAVGLSTQAWDSVLGKRTRFFLPPRSERASLMSLLEVLARTQYIQDAPLPDLLQHASVRMSWGATLVVVTGRESEALFDTLIYLRRTGFALALILVQPGRPSADLQERASLFHLPVHRVWQERDLELCQ